MGRGRQKAKQQKIARKLKYLTTDTDYAELAKELSSQEDGDTQSQDGENASASSRTERSQVAQAVTSSTVDSTVDGDDSTHDDVSGVGVDDDLDDYAKWAAEAAAKATSGELPVVKHAPTEHKPIPIPVPGVLKTKRGRAASAA